MKNLSYSLYLFVYLFFFTAVYVVAIYANLKNKKSLDNFNLLIASILAVIFYFSTAGYSSDSYMYYSQFKYIGKLEDFRWGYSFYMLMKVISCFGSDIDTYLLSTTVLAISLLSYVITLFIKWPSRSLCFVLYLLSFNSFDLFTNAYRQGLASILILISTYFLLSKKYAIALLPFLLAAGMHWTSIFIFIFIGITLFISRYRQIIYISCLITIIVYVFVIIKGSAIVNLDFYDTFSSISLYGFNLDIGSKLNHYIGGKAYGAIFYLLSFPHRVRVLLDVFLVLILVAYGLKRLPRGGSSYDMLMGVSLIFIMLSMYNIILIDMLWFNRNVYWAFMFIPLLLVLYPRLGLCKYESDRYNYYILMSVMYYLYSLVSLWRNPNLLRSIQ